MNNNADSLEVGNKEVCELSSESDSDSESFCIVGVPSDYDSDSFILLGDECYAQNVQDNKCAHTHVDQANSEVHNEIKEETPQEQINAENTKCVDSHVNKESSEADNEIKQETLEDQIDAENTNINNEDNSDENIHDMASPMAEEEVYSTGLVEIKKETPQDQINAENTKCVDSHVNKESSEVDNEIKQETLEDQTDAENTNMNNEDNSDENVHVMTPMAEEEVCSTDLVDNTDNNEIKTIKIHPKEEETDKQQEFSEYEKEKLVIATSKHNEDVSEKFLEDVVYTESEIKEIDLVESNPVVSETNNGIDKGNEHLDDDCSEKNNINIKEEYADEEEEYTDEEEEYTDEEDESTDEEKECTDKKEQLTDKIQEFSDNKNEKPENATNKHSEDNSDQFCKNIVNNKIETTEISLEENSSVVPEASNSVNKVVEQLENDHCNDIDNINSTEEKIFIEEEKFANEEIESSIQSTKHSEDDSEKFPEDIVNNECKIKEIQLVEGNPVVSQTKKGVYKESENLDDDCSETININVKDEYTDEEEECTDEEEEYTDEEDESTDEEEECTDKKEQLTDKIQEFSDDKKEKLENATNKHSEDNSDQFCKNIVNNKIETTEISLEENSSVVPEASNSVNKVVEQLENDHCNDIDNINSTEEKIFTEEEKFANEEKESSIQSTKHSEDDSEKFPEDIVNNECKIKEIQLVEGNPVVSQTKKGVYKENENLDDDCSETININVKDEYTDEEEECTDEEEEYTDEEDESTDEEEECTDKKEQLTDKIQEFSDDKKEKLENATNKHSEDNSDHFCKNIVNNKIETTEINPEKNSSVVPEEINSVNKEIEQLENDHCNLIDNINSKEEQKFTEEEIFADEEKESSIRPTQHSEDGSESFLEDVVNNESKIKEIELVESNPVVPEANKGVHNENEHIDDDCREINNINIKEGYADEEDESTDEEDESTDEEEEFTDEAKLATPITEHTEDESDQFSKDIVNSENKPTEINLKESCPIVLEESNGTYKDIKQVESDHCNATDGINSKDENKKQTFTDKEEKVPDKNEESAITMTKLSEDSSDKFGEDMGNSKTKIAEINFVESNVVVPETNKSVGKENDHADDHCSETNSNNIKKQCTNAEEEYSDEEEESCDEEEEFTDAEGEYTDEEEEFTDEEELATAITKHNEDRCNEVCKDMVDNKTKTAEIIVAESSPVVPETSDSLNKKIDQLEGNRCNVIYNTNSKEGCSDEEKNISVEKENTSMTTNKNSESDFNSLSENIVKTEEINLERNESVVIEKDEINKENERAECSNRKGRMVDQVSQTDFIED